MYWILWNLRLVMCKLWVPKNRWHGDRPLRSLCPRVCSLAWEKEVTFSYAVNIDMVSQAIC